MLFIRKEYDGWQKYTTNFPIIGGGFLRLPDTLEYDFDRFAPYVSVAHSDGEVSAVSEDVLSREEAIQQTPEISQEQRIFELESIVTELLYGGDSV